MSPSDMMLSWIKLLVLVITPTSCRIPHVNYCASQPCKNGATCWNNLKWRGPNTYKYEYTCICHFGWAGVDCSIEGISVVDDKKVNFAQASHFCQSQGMHLAMPKTAEEQTILKEAVDAANNKILIEAIKISVNIFWIGMKRVDTDWQWVDNTPLGKYRPWASGQPDNLNDEQNCVDFRLPKSYNHGLRYYYPLDKGLGLDGWSDGNCNDKRAFICQKPAQCRSGWRLHKSKCYKYVIESTVSYGGAENKCILENAIVAEPKTEEELNFLRSIVGQNPNRIWLGGIRINASHFGWRSNPEQELVSPPIPWSRWQHNRPNDFNWEKCMMLDWDNLLKPVKCWWLPTRFVCSSEKIEPTTIQTAEEPDCLAMALPTTNEKDCPNEFEPLGKGCYFLSENPCNHGHCKEVCSKIGGILGEPINWEKNCEMLQFARSKGVDMFWIGLTFKRGRTNTNQGSARQWRWELNGKMQWSNWDKGQPATRGSSRAVVTSSGKWRSATSGWRRVICQPVFKDADKSKAMHDAANRIMCRFTVLMTVFSIIFSIVDLH